jgi:hypothetical protein
LIPSYRCSLLSQIENIPTKETQTLESFSFSSFQKVYFSPFVMQPQKFNFSLFVGPSQINFIEGLDSPKIGIL